MAEPTVPPPRDDALRVSPDSSRRRLLQGGLGAAPLLMTLVSRPALGNNRCFSPSGFVSMPTSMHGQPQFCQGRTPGFWKNSWDDKQDFKKWPPPFVATGSGATKFNAFFAVSPSPYTNPKTFLDVLKTEDQGFSGPPHNVARHIVASVLNVQKGWVPVLTLASVKGIWSQYMSTGGIGGGGWYEPTAGVKWFQEQIVAYLTSTMTGGDF
jgi:hypothetical protein